MAKTEKFTENEAKTSPSGGVLVGKRDGHTIVHEDGTMGGYLVGKLHKEGGIKAVNKATGQPLEMQGAEVVITAPAVADQTKKNFNGKMMTNRQILSEINKEGGGVEFADGGEVPDTIMVKGRSYNFGEKRVKDYNIVKSCGCKHGFADGGDIDRAFTMQPYRIEKLESGDAEHKYRTDIVSDITDKIPSSTAASANSSYYQHYAGGGRLFDKEMYSKGGVIKSIRKYSDSTISDRYNFVEQQQEYGYQVQLEDGRSWEGYALDRSDAKQKAMQEFGITGGKLKLTDIPEEVRRFMPVMQQKAIVGSEEHWETLEQLKDIIKRMPKTYETEKTPINEKIVYLRYFYGQSDWYIVEKDMIEEEQQQAFGYAILNGDMQNAEWGYISIEELKATNRIELDFYFTPIKFGELKKEWEEDEEVAEAKEEMAPWLEGKQPTSTGTFSYGDGWKIEKDAGQRLKLKLIDMGFEILVEKPFGISVTKDDDQTKKMAITEYGGSFSLADGKQDEIGVIDYLTKENTPIPLDTIAKEINTAYNIYYGLQAKPSVANPKILQSDRFQYKGLTIVREYYSHTQGVYHIYDGEEHLGSYSIERPYHPKRVSDGRENMHVVTDFEIIDNINHLASAAADNLVKKYFEKPFEPQETKPSREELFAKVDYHDGWTGNVIKTRHVRNQLMELFNVSDTDEVMNLLDLYTAWYWKNRNKLEKKEEEVAQEAPAAEQDYFTEIYGPLPSIKAVYTIGNSQKKELVAFKQKDDGSWMVYVDQAGTRRERDFKAIDQTVIAWLQDVFTSPLRDIQLTEEEVKQKLKFRYGTDFISQILDGEEEPVAEDRMLRQGIKTIDLAPFKGKGWEPALSVRAFDVQPDGDRLMFLQYQPSSHIMNLTNKTHRDKFTASHNKAKELGYSVYPYKGGKYGQVYVYQKDGKALAQSTFEALAEETTEPAYQISEPEVKIVSEEIINPFYEEGDEDDIDETWNPEFGKVLKAALIKMNDGQFLYKYDLKSVAIRDDRNAWFRFDDGSDGYMDLDRGATIHSYNPPAYDRLKEISAALIAAATQPATVNVETISYVEKYKNASQTNINIAIRDIVNKKGTDRNQYSADEIAFIQLYEGGGAEKKTRTDKAILTQFFTPMDICEPMWGLAFKYGFKFQGSNILDPSTGTGRYLKFIPKDAGAYVRAYEIDEVTYKIAKILYPDADIRFESFEQMFFKGTRHVGLAGVDKFYDLVITNPPYFDYISPFAKLGEKDATGAFTFEMYFIMRGVDVLKKGGLLVYIIPSTFMSNGSKYNEFKEKLAEKCELLEAYRLPNGVFSHTDVCTDIIVLRKK
jgi:hypothetical protein